MGNLGGFFGPSIVGVIKDKTGSNVAALVFLGGALLTMAVLTLAVAKSKSVARRIGIPSLVSHAEIGRNELRARGSPGSGR